MGGYIWYHVGRYGEIAAPKVLRMTSVILLENDVVMQSALMAVIEELDQLELLGVSNTVTGGKELLNLKPDFALVDLMLDDGLAYELISEATNKYATKILIISILGDESSVIRAIQAGASGYIKKDATSIEVSDAIASILRGETPMSPKIARHLLRQVQNRGSANLAQLNNSSPALSPREQQVLEALAHGLNYKEVARKYDLSHHTVAKYIKTIYRKLSVNSRAEAVIAGMKSGMISLDED